VLFGLGLWLALLGRYRSRPAFDPADAQQVAVTETGAIVVRPERQRWAVTFMTCLGTTAFLVSWVLFYVGFGLGAAYRIFDGFLLDPPVAVPATVWAAVLAGSALATWRLVRTSPVLTL